MTSPDTTAICPSCGSGQSVQIVYGLPSFRLFKASERGEVAIGGCIVGREGGDPDRQCRDCGHEWVSARM
jgi:hypothetical protein